MKQNNFNFVNQQNSEFVLFQETSKNYIFLINKEQKLNNYEYSLSNISIYNANDLRGHEISEEVINDALIFFFKKKKIKFSNQEEENIFREKENEFINKVSFILGLKSNLNDYEVKQLLKILSTITNEFYDNATISITSLEDQIGIIGELLFLDFLIKQCYINREKIFDLISIKNNGRYDFSINNKLKIEVKSTLGNERKHYFNLKQLDEDNDLEVIITSIKIKENEKDMNVKELFSKIVRDIDINETNLERIYKKINFINKKQYINFSYNDSLRNMKFFDGKCIPKPLINNDDKEKITEVRFKSIMPELILEEKEIIEKLNKILKVS